MQIKVKLLSFNEPASDSSRVSRDVVEDYMRTEEYKTAIASKKMLGTLSHYARNVATGVRNLNPSISKSAGKDDLLIIPGEAAPTHYITGLECGNDGWLYAYAEILNEKGMDDQAIQNIRRLRGMLEQGIMVGVSAVILGFWDGTKAGDVLKKLVNLKGFDITLNPSWKRAQVVQTIGDDGEIIADLENQKEFSDTINIEFDNNLFSSELKAKTFSDLSAFNTTDLPKSSKINGSYTVLKAKQFSSGNIAELVEGVEEPIVAEVQKEYSVASLKERARYAKLSPRMRFRRLFIEYKQLVKTMGGPGKMDPETERVLKSMFATDCLDIIKTISPDVMAGKQINTLIGASSLGKNVRVAAQKLQMPFRFAMQEANRQGFVSKNRYEKIQSAYMEFIQAMTDEVFGNNPIPEGLEKEVMEEEEEK